MLGINHKAGEFVCLQSLTGIANDHPEMSLFVGVSLVLFLHVVISLLAMAMEITFDWSLLDLRSAENQRKLKESEFCIISLILRISN